MNTVQAGFERQATFAALKEHQVMGHAQVYEILSRIFRKQPPFTLIDVGCADAADISSALRQSAIRQYTGVDNSAEALTLAEKNISELNCPTRLILGDYAEIKKNLPGSADIIWMGLFLHHLDTEQKKDFLSKSLELLSDHGMLLAHDPLLLETESREDFRSRLIRHGREHWSFLGPKDLEGASRHWTAHGRQESFATLRQMGLDAGFAAVDLLWSDPNQFYGLLLFRREKERNEGNRSE